MQKFSYYLLFIILFAIFSQCKQPEPQENLVNFNEEFFKIQIPEVQESRLLTKADLPVRQQSFFDEADGQLQLLVDLNRNKIPEYIVTGISDYIIRTNGKKPYFIAVFERQNNEIKRLFFKQVFVPPVHLSLLADSDEPKVVVSFAFYSDYGAEMYYQDGEYNLEQW